MGPRGQSPTPTPAIFLLKFMHILYTDESGHPLDPQQKYFVLVGVSVFEKERQHERLE